MEWFYKYLDKNPGNHIQIADQQKNKQRVFC